MRQNSLPSAGSNAPPQVRAVLRELARHPVHAFVGCWNWKAGALSIILRAPVYILTTLKYGWQAASLAGFVEAVFSAGIAGVYAAFTQAVRYAEPQFVVASLLLVFLPGVALGFDALLHYVARTPNLHAGVMASLVVSVVSSAFNWYSMRRGTLLMGPRSRSFGADLAAFPILIGGFLAEPFVWLWRAAKFGYASLVEE